MKPRSRWEIIYDILKETSREEKKSGGYARKTRIMQAAYLDWRNFNRHLTFLMENGFIGCQEEDCYYLTERGRDLLDQLREVRNTINESSKEQRDLF